jgi:hypothetical protein
MIFHKDKIIFFHPGKTGGTSIEVSLTKRNFNKEFSQLQPKVADYSIMYGFCKTHKIYLHHADTRFYLINNIPIHEDYQKITSIRRPYEKVLSAYYYNGWDKKLPFRDFVLNKLTQIFNKNSSYAINHFCPQVHYVREGFEIIQLENILQDCDRLNIELPTRKHAQTRANQVYKNYLAAYDLKMKDKIHKLYKEDFETFSYNK